MSIHNGIDTSNFYLPPDHSNVGDWHTYITAYNQWRNVIFPGEWSAVRQAAYNLWKAEYLAMAGGLPPAPVPQAPVSQLPPEKIVMQHELVKETPKIVETCFYLLIMYYFNGGRWRCQTLAVDKSLSMLEESFAVQTKQDQVNSYLVENPKLEYQLTKIEEGKITLIKSASFSQATNPIRKIKPVKNANSNAQISSQDVYHSIPVPAPTAQSLWHSLAGNVNLVGGSTFGGDNTNWEHGAGTVGQQGGVTAG